MDATTIAAIRGSRANRAGSLCDCTNCVRSGCQRPVGDEYEILGGIVCQEADQHSQSARRNTRGNRDNGTKQSAGISENRRRPLLVAWMIWPNCAHMLQNRQRYLISAQRTLVLQRTPAVPTSANNSRLQVSEGLMSSELTVRSIRQ